MNDIERTIPNGRLDKSMPFAEQVWAMTSRIPKGKVTTYGAMAKAMGRPRSARAVGQALGRNPHAPRVPCHRVVGGDGRLTGYSGDGGVQKKKRMLEAEGVRFVGDRVAGNCIITFGHGGPDV